MVDCPFSRRTPGRAKRAAPAGALCRFAIIALIAGLGLGATGCAPSLSGAMRAYEHARYPEAMEELRTVEPDACHWDTSDSARYALYRGLAHLALGDLAATRFWFGRVERATAVDPGLLSADDAVKLASARAHLPR
ncbi:MAG TPA: hypothetical protein VK550_18485 [Polyangiaceae bacterium]|nr:hypothetical protein [Polyangiaceae bacterium]